MRSLVLFILPAVALASLPPKVDESSDSKKPIAISGHFKNATWERAFVELVAKCRTGTTAEVKAALESFRDMCEEGVLSVQLRGLLRHAAEENGNQNVGLYVDLTLELESDEEGERDPVGLPRVNSDS